ncbi:hypothetical protein MtrunA17_Chr8g0358711 [Medicago truncatula]|uniref:Transmembrane protein n=1 Tax=Medicago truncatula TaxID=3880 RepID=A0A396GI43_MEDTR|nr:hypothetical protein MtrunA17_Chr8g0358711 [Medicago truncatula]
MLGFGIAWSSGGFLLVLEFLFYCSRSKYEAYMNSGLVWHFNLLICPFLCYNSFLFSCRLWLYKRIRIFSPKW